MAKNLFEKGVSGNPKGRPKGAKNKTNLINEVIEKTLGMEKTAADIAAVFEKVVSQALEGDPAQQKMLMDRFLPIKKFEGVGASKPVVNITINGTEPKVELHESEPIDSE